MMPDYRIARDDQQKGRIGAACTALAVLMATVGVAALPAFAAKPPKDPPPETTTTTTTVPETTTTTTAPTVESDAWFDPWEDASALNNYAAGQYEGSMYWVTNKLTGAVDYWKQGFTGAGIDIALIDTGVVPVDGLRTPGKIINGPDLSFESQAENLRYYDTFGHGTHLAGIIAGRSDDALTIAPGNNVSFLGMAPEARIVNVKVADSQGAVDVSQVIAAVDWVIQHRNDNGMNIRVITMAYGTDGLQPYQIDPLSYIVEKAWDAGIVVVVAAGNDGNPNPLRNPANNPFVISVGASQANNASDPTDDSVPPFSNCGTNERFVDIVAPGKSLVSLRNPGSHADQFNPEAVVADTFFLGSGTSQAAAVVSGAVALLLEQRPELTPDQVKQLLTQDSATILEIPHFSCQGGGALNLTAALTASTPTVQSSNQTYQPSTGTGTLEAARGSDHIYDEGVALEGEQDILTSAWNGYCTEEIVRKKTVTTCVSTLWNGGAFNGASWSGASWSGASWSGASWSGVEWLGASWSGASWSSKSWSGASWSGGSWSGASWSGASWSGASWSGSSWSGLSWH